MGRLWVLLVAGFITFSGPVHAEVGKAPTEWQRVNSRYCTILLDPAINLDQANDRVSTWRVRPRFRVDKGETPNSQLAAKCDTIFRRAEELLDMYPPGIHVTIKIVRTGDELSRVHASRY